MSWEVHHNLIQTVTNSFPYGTNLHRMGLRGSSDYTLCQRDRYQRVDDHHDGCGRIDPETLGHITSSEYSALSKEEGKLPEIQRVCSTVMGWCVSWERLVTVTMVSGVNHFNLESDFS